jgi:hypothetical protein
LRINLPALKERQKDKRKSKRRTGKIEKNAKNKTERIVEEDGKQKYS